MSGSPDSYDAHQRIDSLLKQAALTEREEAEWQLESGQRHAKVQAAAEERLEAERQSDARALQKLRDMVSAFHAWTILREVPTSSVKRLRMHPSKHRLQAFIEGIRRTIFEAIPVLDFRPHQQPALDYEWQLDDKWLIYCRIESTFYPNTDFIESYESHERHLWKSNAHYKGTTTEYYISTQGTLLYRSYEWRKEGKPSASTISDNYHDTSRMTAISTEESTPENRLLANLHFEEFEKSIAAFIRASGHPWP